MNTTSLSMTQPRELSCSKNPKELRGRALELQQILKAGSFRFLRKRENLIDLTSNDYLGLSADPLFQRSSQEKWTEWSQLVSQKRVGSTGSRLLTGNHRFFEEMEEKIARFHGFETATLFNCGYMANLGLLTSIFNDRDTLIADLMVHASLHDGIKLSKARTVYFRHNDLNHLESRLKNSTGRRFVIIESFYSMGGKAPLQEIADLCTHYQASLIVDEAHAVGVVGKKGEGWVGALALQNKVFACMVGFGKALGAHGAALLGNRLLKQTLINFARPLIYTIAMPLPLLAAIDSSYERLPLMQKERAHIRKLCEKFGCATQIYPLFLEGNAQAKLASLYLFSKGFDIRPILSPTVPKGQELLRLVVHAFNTEEEIHSCLEAISTWRKG